jgi:2-polyprenyl-6-methoxyphenol hydroxylase-like FAD-dependent oxidoreductase
MTDNLIDVLIVGAGPVGLFLANECARRGLSYRILETKSSQSEHSKALAVFPRTLEIFDMAGLATPFLERANRVTWVAIITHDRRLARLHFTPEGTPYSFVAMVPQDVTEHLLLEALESRGGRVEYETTFLSAAQDEQGVSATVEHHGERHEIRAKYVVGCDGAHSAVRHALHLPFEGAEYSGFFLLADIETNESLAGDEMQLCPSELGAVAIFPMSATRRRMVATIDHQEGEAPSLELVRKIIAERAPAGLEALSLRWSSYFRIHHRLVGSLREGRIFIAGDAAHIHSPFGGQGMNTGLHDVWNLAWKLDLAVRGLGSDPLLDSYSSERLPVIKGVIDTTDFLTKAMGTSSTIAQAVRNTVIPLMSHIAPAQHAFVQRLSELGIAYSGSPIIEGPGKRYFAEWMRGGNASGQRFVLLHPAVAPGIEELTNSFADVLEARVDEEPGLKLVRPDGYLAFAAHRANESALAEIRTVLGRQLSHAPKAA